MDQGATFKLKYSAELSYHFTDKNGVVINHLRAEHESDELTVELPVSFRNDLTQLTSVTSRALSQHALTWLSDIYELHVERYGVLDDQVHVDRFEVRPITDAQDLTEVLRYHVNRPTI